MEAVLKTILIVLITRDETYFQPIFPDIMLPFQGINVFQEDPWCPFAQMAAILKASYQFHFVKSAL